MLMTGVWNVVVAAFLAFVPVPADDTTAAGLKLLSEGDSLADEGKTTEAEIKYQEAMEKLLPNIRGLTFKHTVKRDVTPREGLVEVARKDIEEEMTAQELKAEELSLKAFGLWPRKLDYLKTKIKVLSEEIGAFYDPKTETMHLIKETGAGRKSGLLESLLGRKAGFNKDETKITIAHELTHALDDQHFELDTFLDAAKGNEDSQLARIALVEGDATLVMMGAASQDWKGEVTALLPAEDLGRTFSLLSPFLRFAGGASLGSAPPIMAEGLLFPYLRGLVFCAHLTNKGGWKAIDTAYKNPPTSTEQILHPAKYRDNRDEPTEIDLGKLDAGSDWKELKRDVLGELQVSVLVRSHNGRAASEGWDGDKYATFEGPNDKLALTWFTTWDSEQDAREFARAMARYSRARVGGDEPAAEKEFETYQTEHDGAAYIIERRGSDVIVIEGFARDTTERLLEALRKAKKTVVEETKLKAGE